jgi:hypothetical protein
MLPQLSAAMRVFLSTRPTDMRKSFDSLSGLVQEGFEADLLTGHLFLFLNRRRDRIKVLYLDRLTSIFGPIRISRAPWRQARTSHPMLIAEQAWVAGAEVFRRPGPQPPGLRCAQPQPPPRSPRRLTRNQQQDRTPGASVGARIPRMNQSLVLRHSPCL